MTTLLQCQPYGGGNVSHYYHFFFACLLPLIDFKFMTTPPEPCYLSPDMLIKMGPFRGVLIDELHLCSPEALLPAHDLQHIPRVEDTMLPSYDVYNNIFYTDIDAPRMDPSTTQPNVFQFLDTKFSLSQLQFRSRQKKIILVIERKLESAYVSNSVNYTSGSTRRRIRNHKALVGALRLQYEESGEYTIRDESLEGKSIRDQYVMFSSASLVIAQHGAALSNIFFMNKSTGHVVEISPPFGRKAMYFRNLAVHLGLSYSSVSQVCKL
jgi:hypothetical protein